MRIVILDPHNEYSSVFRRESSTVEANRFELPFWLFQFEEFLEVVYRGTPAPLEESDFLREAIADAREGFSGAERGGGLAKWNNRSEEGGADAPRPDRQRQTVAQAQLLVPLEKAAVEQPGSRAFLEQMARTGDGSGGAPKCEFHSRSVPEKAHRTASGRRSTPAPATLPVRMVRQVTDCPRMVHADRPQRRRSSRSRRAADNLPMSLRLRRN